MEHFISDEKLKRLKISSDHNFKLEKLPLPVFDGNIRNYARFRNDFKELVLPSIPSQKAAYALRKCLPSSIQLVLGSCEDDINVMFERLDKRYADPGKIVDTIISEIKGFRQFDTDESVHSIQFVNILDTAYLDLCKLGLSCEVENANIVSLIESKLLQPLELEWYRYVYRKDSKVNKTNKFPDLLGFLWVERDVLEYATSNMRSSSSRQANINIINAGDKSNEECLLHKSRTHSTGYCWAYLNERYDVLNENSACFGRLKPGHMLQDCTQKVVCSNECRRFHHKSLHSQVNGTSNAVIDYYDESVILPVMTIQIDKSNNYISTLWDSAATISLITFRKAASLNLKGKPIKLCITTAGGNEVLTDSYSYVIPLRDLSRRTMYIYPHVELIKLQTKFLLSRIRG